MPSIGTATPPHLRHLEDESIHIIREVVAECEKPVMLFSIGKDSMCMLHVAWRAFRPGKLPFPLMHVDTTFKFPEMYAYREKIAQDYGAELIVYKNEEALDQIGHDPANWSCTQCADLLKTRGVVKGLQHYGFDAAFGGARRDEEKSRAKERIFSYRNRHQQWDPKNQRPELWNLYNATHAPLDSFRVFPLSNWTELNVWQYIQAHKLPIVPLYFSAPRPVIKRGGTMLMAHDIVKPKGDEKIETCNVRFRSLGCQLCTGCVESDVTEIDGLIAEVAAARKSERENRVVDKDKEGSMEEKKREGYF
ncbi:MAG: sulfate adenylyltransferase subunit CysD [Tepidisphaeraceae bacterium]